MTNFMHALSRAVRPAIFVAVLAAAAPAANAQTKPSAAEIADANKLIQIIGATNLFTPLIAGVVEQAKLLFLQQNPGLAPDLNAVALQLRTLQTMAEISVEKNSTIIFPAQFLSTVQEAIAILAKDAAAK